MNCFACFDPFSSIGGVYGRGVANRDFLRALLKFSSFDEFHFFLGDLYEKDTFFQNKPYVSESDKKRIKLFLRQEAKPLFARYDYAVIFQPDICLGDIMCWRNIFAKYIPVCGVTHSISYQRFVLEYAKYNAGYKNDGLVVTSDAAFSVMQRVFERMGLDVSPRLRIIPLGIEQKHKDFSTKQKAGYKKDDFIFLSIGRISEYTKADLLPLIRAFYLLRKRAVNARLILAGDASESNYAQVLRLFVEKLGLSAYVKIYEDITEEEKHSLYSIADCFVSISDNLQETFGITLLEAGAYGLPVIASNWDGYKSIIDDGKTGILIDTIISEKVWAAIQKEAGIMYENSLHFAFAQATVVDPRQLLQAMERLYSNRDITKQLGENAKARILEEYNWKGIIRRYEKFWQELKQALLEGLDGERGACSWNMDYVNDFKDYPSLRITGEEEFALTEFGRQVIDGQMGLFLYEAHSVDISTRVLRRILSMRFPVAARDILNELDKYPEAVIIRHILWLWKEFFIEKK